MITKKSRKRSAKNTGSILQSPRTPEMTTAAKNKTVMMVQSRKVLLRPSAISFGFKPAVPS